MTDHDRKRIHQGRNIMRFREMLGIKQEAPAHELGADWSQKKISLLEQKETVEEAILAQVSEILKIPMEAIQNFDEEQAVNIILITFNDGSFLNTGHTPSFNVKLIENLMQVHITNSN